jgi:tripartite-type tricarboxylate transporter receptor subunit TctC
LHSGAVNALAVHTEKRSSLLPDVPTFAEVGLSYPGQGWWGLAAPKGTPPDIVARINQEFVRLFQEPKFVSYLETQSVVAAPTTPEGFAQFIKDDRKAAESLVSVAKTPRTEYKAH